MSLPSICVVTAAARTNANLVWAAMGDGPDTFSVPLTNANPASPQSTVTHYLMADDGSTAADVQAWQMMAGGMLPDLPNGAQWGQGGIISEAAALAAVTGANLQVYSASGNVSAQQHRDGILQGRGLYLLPAEL